MVISNFFKLAVRNLRKQKGYTALNVVGLSLGIAGGLLLFQFITFHFGFDRYHRKSGQLYRVVTNLHLDDGSTVYEQGAPLDIGTVLKSQVPEVKDQSIFIKPTFVTVGVDGPEGRKYFTEKESVGFVDQQWFGMFDYVWLKGSSGSSLSDAHMAVITRSQAVRYFGKEDPIGKTISLDGSFTATVTGVLDDPPANTDIRIGVFLSRASYVAWHPDIARSMHESWGFINRWAQTFIWLPDGEAAGKVDAVIKTQIQEHFDPSVRKAYRFVLQPLKEMHFDARYNGPMNRSLLVTLALVGVFLLLIACFNFINLATAQSTRRAREIGTRKVLGSTAAAIFWQFMTETVCIVLLAAALSLLLVRFVLPVFRVWLQTPLPFDLLTDRRLEIFLLLQIGVVTLVAGAYPALVLSRWKPINALKKEVSGSLSTFLRKGLVIFQHVIVQSLIICTIIITLQVRYMKNADPGFNRESVLMVPVPDKDQGKQGLLEQQLLAFPGVRSASFCYSAPLTQQTFLAGSVRYDTRAWEDYAARTIPGDSGYVRTFGLHLLAGRNLRSGDSSREFLINETLLHKLGLHDPERVIGHKIVAGSLDDRSGTIVGVVKDFNVQPLNKGLEPVMITPFAERYRFVAIRLAGRWQEGLRSDIEKAWVGLYPDKVFEYRFVNDEIDSFYYKDDLLNKLIDVTSAVAILISCLGLSGLISFFAARRTKEIGIRKVLGATVPGIVYLLSRDFLVMVGEALLVAVPVAWYFMSEWLRGFSYRISIGWWVFALAGLLSAVIALCAVGYQSLRAAMVNPVDTFRAE